jgi:hypothetical protein
MTGSIIHLPGHARYSNGFLAPHLSPNIINQVDIDQQNNYFGTAKNTIASLIFQSTLLQAKDS